MKALSLRQPWAWMVVHGGKHIENRRWNTQRRGPFLIHAAKGMTREEYAGAVAFAKLAMPALVVPPATTLERGGIIGCATLVAVLPPCLLACDVDEDVWCRCGQPWHMGEQFGFVLEAVVPLPFRALRGELGFFEVKAPADDEADPSW